MGAKKRKKYKKLKMKFLKLLKKLLNQAEVLPPKYWNKQF